MSLDYINEKKIRKSFGKIPLVTSLPNLVEVQKRSYDSFLQTRKDIDDTNNICINNLEKKLILAKKEKKLPKILVVVHLSGLPCNLKKIKHKSRYC